MSENKISEEGSYIYFKCHDKEYNDMLMRDDCYVPSVIEKTIPRHLSIAQILEEFRQFLRGLGYPIGIDSDLVVVDNDKETVITWEELEERNRKGE